MERLAGKTALITGGNSGIGLACARIFLEEGARVAITGRDQETLRGAREELGSGLLAIQSDATDMLAIDLLFEDIEYEFGGLDILFLNAGVGRLNVLGDTDPAVFDEIFAVNVKGPFFTLQRALPLLRRGSSVILSGSTSAVTGSPGTALYAASKAALRALARNLSADLLDRGVRVNVISPGPTDTPIWNRSVAPGGPADAVKGRLADAIPLGRLAAPEDLVGAVLFLASDDSAFMLGAEIVVDGGGSELPAAAGGRGA